MYDDQQRPEIKERSWFGSSTWDAAKTGMLVSVAWDAIGAAIAAIWTKGKASIPFRDQLSRAATNAFTIGGATAILHLLTRKQYIEPTVAPIVMPVVPPPTTLAPNTLTPALNGIPQILDILVEQGKLTREQQTNVLTEIGNGRKAFAAEIAVADGYVTKVQVDEALLQQATLKSKAAMQDLSTIADFGAMPGVRSNWGNNGINPSSANPTRADGAIAAANAAQNLIALANADPFLAKTDRLQEGVRAACRLANGIALGDSPLTPIAKMGQAWQATMNLALEDAARAHPNLVLDNKGKPIDIHAYIAERDKEITAAVEQTLAQTPPQKDAGMGR